MVGLLFGCAHQMNQVNSIAVEGFIPKALYEVGATVSLEDVSVEVTFQDGSSHAMALSDERLTIHGINNEDYTLYTSTEGRHNASIKLGHVRYKITYYVADAITVGEDALFQDLDEALKLASPGDTITIESGHYTLNTVIDDLDDLTLVGEGDVTFTPALQNEPILKIKSNEVSIIGIDFLDAMVGVKVSGERFLLDNAAFQGNINALIIDGGVDTNITNNTFIHNENAVMITDQARAVTLNDNAIHGHDEQGIGVLLTHKDAHVIEDHTILSNHFHHLAKGLLFETAGDYSNIDVKDNTFKDNILGIAVGESLGSASQSIVIESNIIMDNHIGVYANIDWHLAVNDNYWGGLEPTIEDHLEDYTAMQTDIMGEVIITQYFLDESRNIIEQMMGF